MTVRATGVLHQVHLHAKDGVTIEVRGVDRKRMLFAVDASPEALAAWFEEERTVEVYEAHGCLFVRPA